MVDRSPADWNGPRKGGASPSRTRGRRRSEDDGDRRHAPLARRGATWLLAVTVVGSVLAVGTVHTTPLLVFATTAFAAAALAIYGFEKPAFGGFWAYFPLPVAACLALSLYTLLQALPIPLAWLWVLAPTNADVWERALLPLRESAPRWASLSLDPSASVIEAAKWGIYAAVLLTASLAARSLRRGAKGGIILIFVSATLAALTTVAHGLASATKVFGLYQPTFAPAPWHVGPLLNPNNLSGYLNLGMFAGLGLLLAREPILPRWIAGLGTMLVLGVDITTASRGGLLTLTAGMFALAWSVWRRGTRGDGRRRTPLWPIGIAVAGGAVLAALGATREAWVELYEKDISKLRMLHWITPLVRDHPWFGIGRGAFESVFPAYLQAPTSVVYTHAENFLAQWACEWGIPVTLAAMIAFSRAFAPRRLGIFRSLPTASFFIGVAVLLTQNIVDLALEVPAVCIAAAAVLGSLYGNVRSPMVTASASLPDQRALASVCVGAFGFAAVVGTGLFGSEDLARERSAIMAAAGTLSYRNAGETNLLRAGLRAAILRHPAEPYFALVGGLVAFRAKDGDPLPWIQRALERGQMNGRAHLLLADVLTSRGAKQQALLELRTAAESDPTLIALASHLAVSWTRDFDELRVAVGQGAVGTAMLDNLAGQLSGTEDRLSQSKCDQEILGRVPTHVGAHTREAMALVAALAAGALPPDCDDREACRRKVLAHAAALATAAPMLSTAAQIRAYLLMADRKPEDAAALLEAECDRVTDRIACVRVRLEAAARIHEPEPFDGTAKQLLALACASNEQCAEMSGWIGDLRLGRSELNLAVSMYTRAAREAPTDDRWRRAADTASRAGLHAQAAEALQTLLQRRPQDAALRAYLDKERNLAMSQLMERTKQ